MKEIRDFKVLLEGNPEAEALVSQEPLSFWGGVDVASGDVLDVHHDLCGENVSGKILCLPYDRGSCSGSGVLIEMVKVETAPAAMICVEAEPVLALGPLIGKMMYGRGMALRTISKENFELLKTGKKIRFTDDAICVEE